MYGTTSIALYAEKSVRLSLMHDAPRTYALAQRNLHILRKNLGPAKHVHPIKRFKRNAGNIQSIGHSG